MNNSKRRREAKLKAKRARTHEALRSQISRGYDRALGKIQIVDETPPLMDPAIAEMVGVTNFIDANLVPLEDRMVANLTDAEKEEIMRQPVAVPPGFEGVKIHPSGTGTQSSKTDETLW